MEWIGVAKPQHVEYLGVIVYDRPANGGTVAASGSSNIKNVFPSDYRASMMSEREMVCGKCGPVGHYIYEISGHNFGNATNDPECAQCSACEDIRPTNTAGNELLHQLKLIPTSEYLSWADNSQ